MAIILPFDNLDDTEFEQVCFDLLHELGFINLDWRKGTGLASSPGDSGRDIVAQPPREELDGHQYYETWFVDCKHYKRGIPPEKVTGLLAWTGAERADVALINASNYLSNPCKDFLKQHERNNRPPYRIKYWERPNLERLLEGRDEFILRYLQSSMRTESEIIQAEQEFFDRIWYDRSMSSQDYRTARGEDLSEDIRQGMLRNRRRVEETYGRESLGPYSDFEWGMINGKLSALRWVMGDDWDFLDT
ncbi:restriction endonuclease [Nonomuraea sp. NPDC003804]|uniref:restriction endonuclease n=1 Tax=Nonomuraea sp. NPDC003804 TaxID=3154547 RepID=UPI0033B2EB54